MEQDVPLLILAVLGLVVLFLVGWVLKLQGDFIQLSRRMQVQATRPPQIDLGTTGIDILDQANERLDEVTRFCRVLDKHMRGCVQHVGLVRFSAFEETGGDQSFALAMLDHQGNGVVLYSLHARAANRLYAKPVQGGESPYPLSDEEERALRMAVTSLDDGPFDASETGQFQRNPRPVRR